MSDVEPYRKLRSAMAQSVAMSGPSQRRSIGIAGQERQMGAGKEHGQHPVQSPRNYTEGLCRMPRQEGEVMPIAWRHGSPG